MFHIKFILFDLLQQNYTFAYHCYSTSNRPKPKFTPKFLPYHSPIYPPPPIEQRPPLTRMRPKAILYTSSNLFASVEISRVFLPAPKIACFSPFWDFLAVFCEVILLRIIFLSILSSLLGSSLLVLPRFDSFYLSVIVYFHALSSRRLSYVHYCVYVIRVVVYV